MLRSAEGARRYNTLVTLTYSEKIVDEYGGLANRADLDYADGKLEEAFKRIIEG